jgi:hypothetical protein
MLVQRKANPATSSRSSACQVTSRQFVTSRPGTRVGRFVLATCLLGCSAFASAAHAQAAGYDTSLRSIGPATINQANFDVRTRSPILSIGPATVENKGQQVPAVYDPAQGRFVSVLGNLSRGAISASSSSMVSVIVSQQSNSFIVGGTSSTTPLRTEALATPSATVTTVLVNATPSNNGR